MRLVIIESPFAGKSTLPGWYPGFAHRIAKAIDCRRNKRYARAAVRDSLRRGEAPIASHLLYTQPGILDDNIRVERQAGIDAGLAWRKVAEASVVYVDRGFSPGMKYGIALAQRAGIEVDYRSIERKWTWRFPTTKAVWNNW